MRTHNRQRPSRGGRAAKPVFAIPWERSSRGWAEIGRQWREPPIFFAIRHNHTYILWKLLWKLGYSEGLDDTGKTALTKAAEGQDPKIVYMLLKAGANPNVVDNTGSTPIFSARDPKIVQMLLKAGANPNVINKHGHTALMVRCTHGDSANIIRILMTGGATVTKSGWSALHMASNYGHAANLWELVNAGASVNCRDDTGYTPLMVALEWFMVCF